MKQRLGWWVLTYLRFFAKLQLKKYAPDIIGIAGSAGKTTTRNAVEAILVHKYRLKVTAKANSESGIPLDILGIGPESYSLLDWLRMILQTPLALLTNWQPFEKYLVEMAIDSPYPPKNMEYLLTIVKPRTGIFLNALPVHTGAFDSMITGDNPTERLKQVIAAIAREKGKLIKSLPATGLAIVNADQPEVMESTKGIKAQVMTFGKSKTATVRIIDINQSEAGTRFTFSFEDQTATLELKALLPEHYAYSFAAALCIALDEGNSLQEGCDLLVKNFVMPAGRMSLFEGIQDTLLIDSSYNSSPGPTGDALELLKLFPKRRKVAILGDMRELGEEAKTTHQQIVNKATSIADVVYTVGPLMKPHTPADHWFVNAKQAAEVIRKEVKPEDVILVKGSQNTIFLETVVEALLKHPEDAAKLCRRGTYWDTQRKKAFR